MKRLSTFFLTGAASLIAGLALAADSLPAEVMGRYAPRGDCSLTPRVVVSDAGIAVETGPAIAQPTPVEVCVAACARNAARTGTTEQVMVWTKAGNRRTGLYRIFPRQGLMVAEEAGRTDAAMRALQATPALQKCRS